MGLEGLFEITRYRLTDGRHLFDVEIDPSHEVFRGHFPGMPVMPGVCSMYIIRQCAAMTTGRRLVFDTVKQCKFVSSVLPSRHTRLEVNLMIQPDEGVINISGTMNCAGQVMVKIKANLI